MIETSDLFEKIALAAKRFGRNPADITVVAATKMQSQDTVSQLPEYGITIAGENRVQEFLSKYSVDMANVEWQFIGRLQTNKVKYLVDKVSLIQSVDSIGLAKEISHRSAIIGKTMPILIEVNIGGETQKGGVAPDLLSQTLDQIKLLRNVRVQGLMTVMPVGASSSLYRQMYRLFEITKAQNKDLDIKYLSMGMSGDFQIAIENGSNMIRIGEKIFGKRIYNE